MLKNNWMKMIMKIGKNGFGRRRNKRGVFLASLIGVGMSAATFFIGKNQTRNRDRSNKLQSLMQNFQQTKTAGMPNFAGLTEFAEELTPKQGASSKNNDSNANNNYSETIPNENPLNND